MVTGRWNSIHSKSRHEKEVEFLLRINTLIKMQSTCQKVDRHSTTDLQSAQCETFQRIDQQGIKKKMFFFNQVGANTKNADNTHIYI